MTKKIKQVVRKGGFFSESMMRLLNLQNQKIDNPKNYPELELLCSKKQKSGKIQTTNSAKLRIVKRSFLSWRIWR